MVCKIYGTEKYNESALVIYYFIANGRVWEWNILALGLQYHLYSPPMFSTLPIPLPFSFYFEWRKVLERCILFGRFLSIVIVMANNFPMSIAGGGAFKSDISVKLIFLLYLCDYNVSNSTQASRNIQFERRLVFLQKVSIYSHCTVRT